MTATSPMSHAHACRARTLPRHYDRSRQSFLQLSGPTSMHRFSTRTGWALLRADKVTMALFGVSVVAAVWSLVAGIGESPAWLVAAAAGLTGAVRLQRKAIKANQGRPLLHASVPDGAGGRLFPSARRALLAVVGGGDSPLQPLLMLAAFTAVLGPPCSTLFAGSTTLDPAEKIDLGEMVSEAGAFTLAAAAVAGIVAGAAIAVVTGTVAIRRAAGSGSNPTNPPDAGTAQPRYDEAYQTVRRGRRRRILIAACAAGGVGGTAGGAVAAAIVLLIVEQHPSNIYGPGADFLLSVSLAAFVSLAGWVGVVISPNVRACAEALADDPHAAQRPRPSRLTGLA